MSLDTTMQDVPSSPNPQRPPAQHRDASVGKPETPGRINTVLYDEVSGSPGSLETTLSSVLEISFNK